MKKLLLIPILLALVGCAGFSTHVFRMEQTAVTVAYGGYVGWTNYLLSTLENPNTSPDRRATLVMASNSVKQARLRFAATVATVEALRASYETNSAVKPAVEAGLQTIISESSNVCWLITYWRSQ